MARRRWLIQRAGAAQEGLFGRGPAHHRAGLLATVAYLCNDLWLRQAARFHAVSGRAAALLPSEMEVGSIDSEHRSRAGSVRRGDQATGKAGAAPVNKLSCASRPEKTDVPSHRSAQARIEQVTNAVSQ